MALRRVGSLARGLARELRERRGCVGGRSTESASVASAREASTGRDLGTVLSLECVIGNLQKIALFYWTGAAPKNAKRLIISRLPSNQSLSRLFGKNYKHVDDTWQTVIGIGPLLLEGLWDARSFCVQKSELSRFRSKQHGPFQRCDTVHTRHNPAHNAEPWKHRLPRPRLRARRPRC